MFKALNPYAIIETDKPGARRIRLARRPEDALFLVESPEGVAWRTAAELQVKVRGKSVNVLESYLLMAEFLNDFVSSADPASLLPRPWKPIHVEPAWRWFSPYCVASSPEELQTALQEDMRTLREALSGTTRPRS